LGIAAEGNPKSFTKLAGKTAAATGSNIVSLFKVTDPLTKFLARTPEERQKALEASNLKFKDFVSGLKTFAKGQMEFGPQSTPKELAQEVGTGAVRTTKSAASALEQSLGQIGPTIKSEPQKGLAVVAEGFIVGGLVSKLVGKASGAGRYADAIKPPSNLRVSSVKKATGKSGQPITVSKGKIESVVIEPRQVETIRRSGEGFRQVTVKQGADVVQKTTKTLESGVKLKTTEIIKSGKASITVTEVSKAGKSKVVFKAKDIPVASGSERLAEPSFKPKESTFKRQEIVQANEGRVIRERQKIIGFKGGQPVTAKTIQPRTFIGEGVAQAPATIQIERSIAFTGKSARKIVSSKTLEQVIPKGPTRVQQSIFSGVDDAGRLSFKPTDVSIEAAKIRFGSKTKFPDAVVKPAGRQGEIVSIQTPDLRTTVFKQRSELIQFRKKPSEGFGFQGQIIFNKKAQLSLQKPGQVFDTRIFIKPSTPTVLKGNRFSQVPKFASQLPSRGVAFVPTGRVSTGLSSAQMNFQTTVADIGSTQLPSFEPTVAVQPTTKVDAKVGVDAVQVSVPSTSTTTKVGITTVSLPQVVTRNTFARPSKPMKPIVALPFPSFKLNIGNKAKDQMQQDGYNVFVKEKGKFVKANEEPLPYNTAWNLGAKATDNTPSATFTLKKSKDKVDSFKQKGGLKDLFLSNKFIQKNKQQTFEEKNAFRIDTAGEKKGITVKGWLASRDKAASKRALNNFLR
jgi:hypothetical protein